MTSETKCFIDFSDVVGIELQCPDCKATFTHTLEKFITLSYPCPNCRAPIIAQNQTDDETLGNFVHFLKLVQSLKTPARIRLQIRLTANLGEGSRGDSEPRSAMRDDI
jgi:hypothetical protein